MAVAIEHPGEDDGEAFAAVYREARDPLVAYCRRLVGAEGDPEALAQEALVRSWRSWDPSGPPFWPWAVTVARNLSVDQHRRAGRRAARAPLATLALLHQPFADPEDEVVRAAEHEAVRRAFETLPAPYQTVVEMHHVEGRSYQEIADLQSVSTETVRGMLRRARHALRAAYARFDALPVIVAITGVLRRAHHRVDDWAARTQVKLANTNTTLVPLDAVRGAVALAFVLGTGAATLPATDLPSAPRPHEAAAAPMPGDVPTGAAKFAPARDGVTSSTGATGMDGGGVELPAPSLPLGLDGDTASTPEEAFFTHLAPTGHPSAANTVFAVGESRTSCPTVSCPLLFQSDDGGASWRRLGATGFRGGTVMLPPAYPADPRIFVLGPHALQESTDGGATFVARTPAGRNGAMSPAFSSGDPVIWVGFAPGWVYHDDTKAVTPLQMWPPPVADHATYAFSPAWPADDRVLLGGWNAGSDGPQSATVSLCEASQCRMPSLLPGAMGSPELLTLPSFQTTGTAVAWSGDKLYRTENGGRSFRLRVLPAPGKVSSIVATPDDRLYMAMADVTLGGPIGGLYVSDDRGDTWRELGDGTRLDKGVASVAALPNGNLLAAIHMAAGGGLLCSSDDGRTWARRC